MNWLEKHNLYINWKKRTIAFPNCSHGTKKEDRSSSTVPLAKAIWVRPRGRVLAGLDIEELPGEYKEFKHLFEEKEGKAALLEH